MTKKLVISPFGLFNIIQFLAAINENVYKLLAAYFLIYELGVKNTNTIMAAVGAVFLIPFLLFSNAGGILADKWPKNKIVIITRFLELICLIVALFLFGYHIRSSAYVILFLMASLGAIFGPSKYGLIPELIKPGQLLWANSLVAALTFLGIIIGTSLASFTAWATGNHYVYALLVCVVLALTGFLLSLLLPKTPVLNVNKKFRFFFFSELWKSLKQAWPAPFLFSTLMIYAYSLFIGAFVQLNVIPYAIDVLKMTDVDGGYFFLLTALGLGFGAFMTNRISQGVIRLGLIPLAGAGISLSLFCLNWFYSPWWLIIIWMFILGFFGGIFIVPAQAYILALTPEKDHGRNFGTANFLSFSFALLASFTLYFLNSFLELSPALSFLTIGILNLFIMIALCISYRKIISN